MSDLTDRLLKATIASCNCGVKTPDSKFHNLMCRYRLFDEAFEALTSPPQELAPNPDRKMKAIPIRAAEKIAKEYGYDQVVIYARRVGEEPEPHGEHMTTYGINKTHCGVAARMGDSLKKFMGWDVK